MIITSIDVGFKGGIVKHQIKEDNYLYLIDVYKMPIKYKEVKRKFKGKYKNVKMPELIIEEIQHILLNSDIVVIEDVHPFPKEGAVSSFRFGFQKGVLTGLAVSTAGINNVVFVSPQTWKRFYKLPKEKYATVKYVNECYGTTFTEKDDGICDAIMIGRYYIDNNIYYKGNPLFEEETDE